MLTRQLAIAEYDFRKSRLIPDRLTRTSHAKYREYAEQLLAIYRSGVGRTRRELHRAAAAVFGEEVECPQRRIDAFCKLLDDSATYLRDKKGQAAALRKRVFRFAASRHPLVRQADRLFETEEGSVKTALAAEIGRPWREIEAELYADIIEFHRLSKPPNFENGLALLARYNVAQVQAALFDAVSLTVWATDDLKTILRYAKLARLMHTISREPSGRYKLQFDGPASVLRETRRYGAAMARFLPALVACRGWRMHAVLRTHRGGWNLSLDLTDKEGLTSHLPAPEEFDSSVEEAFAERWGPEKRDGWQLVREGEVLHQGQHVFVPDFLFRHDDGRTALLEIIGFWTPEYLAAKLATLRKFSDRRILLAVTEQVGRALPPLSPEPIVFKSALHVKDVLAQLSAIATCPNRQTDLG